MILPLSHQQLCFHPCSLFYRTRTQYTLWVMLCCLRKIQVPCTWKQLKLLPKRSLELLESSASVPTAVLCWSGLSAACSALLQSQTLPVPMVYVPAVPSMAIPAVCLMKLDNPIKLEYEQHLSQLLLFHLSETPASISGIPAHLQVTFVYGPHCSGCS